MEIHSISSSTALLSLRSASFCPEAQRSHVQILPKHAGWQLCVYTQDNSQSKFLFSGFRSCFHVVLNRLCLGARSNMVSLLLCLDDCWLPPTADVGGLCRVLAQVCCSSRPTSHSQTSRRWWWLSLPTALCQLGNRPPRSCISLVPLDRLSRVCVQWLIQWIWRAEMSQNCIIPVKTPGYPQETNITTLVLRKRNH